MYCVIINDFNPVSNLFCHIGNLFLDWQYKSFKIIGGEGSDVIAGTQGTHNNVARNIAV